MVLLLGVIFPAGENRNPLRPLCGQIGRKAMIEIRDIHKTFGAGKIKAVENGHVVITFGASDSEEPTEKKFVYPDAFKNFLKISLIFNSLKIF